MQETQETRVQSLGWEDPLEKGVATHSSIIAWRIPQTDCSLVGYSPWGHKESDMTKQLTLSFFIYFSINEFLRFLFWKQVRQQGDIKEYEKPEDLRSSWREKESKWEFWKPQRQSLYRNHLDQGCSEWVMSPNEMYPQRPHRVLRVSS